MPSVRDKFAKTIAAEFLTAFDREPTDSEAAALTAVGWGWIEADLGTFPPMPAATVREQVAAKIVSFYSDGQTRNEEYRAEFRATIRSLFKKADHDAPAAIVAVLTLLAAGIYDEDHMPHAARVAIGADVASKYLHGLVET